MQESFSIPTHFSCSYKTGMQQWAKRLYKKWAETGWSKMEFARRSGVSYDSVVKYLKGDVAQPRGNTLQKLAKPLGTTMEWLRDGSVTGEHVPLISMVTAGQLAVIEDPYPKGEGEDDIVFAWHHPRCFALRVTGESMNRVSPEGSVIIVDPLDRELKSGQRYIFAIDGESTYKVYRSNPDRLEPESFNVFEAIYTNGRDAMVVGRVVRTFMDFER